MNHLELDQEEEDRRKQEVEAAKAMEDGVFDDPIEPEDPTDVRNIKFIIKYSLFLKIFILNLQNNCRYPINVNRLIHIRKKI